MKHYFSQMEQHYNEMNEYDHNYMHYEIVKYFLSLGISLDQIRIYNNMIEINLHSNIEQETICEIGFGNNIFKSYPVGKRPTFLRFTDHPAFTIHRLITDNLTASGLNIFNLSNFPRKIFNNNCPISIDISNNRNLVDISNFPEMEKGCAHSIYLTRCDKLVNLYGLPQDFTGSLYINETQIKSFDNIPCSTQMLQICSTNITSFHDITQFQSLRTLYATNLKSYENIPHVLLCERLTNISFTNSIPNSSLNIQTLSLHNIMIEFNSKVNKSEYIMDCSLRLIENGFEKYV